MFDFAWSELGLIALVSVMVLGPKQLPETMRTMAKVVRRVRSLGAEFQGHVNEMIREAELEELRAKVQQFSATSVAEEVTKVVDPTGELAGHLEAPTEAAAPADPHGTPAVTEPTAAPSLPAAEGVPAAASPPAEPTTTPQAPAADSATPSKAP